MAEEGAGVSGCAVPRDAMPEFVINLSMPEPDMNFFQSQRFLSEGRDTIHRDWARTQNEKVWIEKGYMAGLIRGGMGWTMEANFNLVPDEQGGECPVFDSVFIDIYYTSTIFIAEEIREGSCDFHVVLNHQLEHHDINQNLMRSLPAALKEDFFAAVKAVESYPPVHTEGVTQRLDLMKRNIGDLINVHLEAMVERMDVENATIDTMEGYVRGRDMCEVERRFEKKLAPARR